LQLIYICNTLKARTNVVLLHTMRKENTTINSNPLFDLVVKKLLSYKVNFKVIEHKPLFSIGDVLATMNILPEQMGKTIILSQGDGKLIALITPGLLQADLARVAKYLKMPRNFVKFATKNELEGVGVVVGSISPFFDCISRVIVDEKLLSQEIIYCGSGDLCKTISITASDLIKVTGADVTSVTKT